MIYDFTLILLAAASGYAGKPIAAQIPFPFHVGNSIFPAGSYTADISAVPGMLHLRSADGNSSMMMVSNPVRSSTAPTQAKLIFTNYGDEYFLFQVWQAGSDTGRELRKSRREKKLAAAANRGTQTILAYK